MEVRAPHGRARWRMGLGADRAFADHAKRLGYMFSASITAPGGQCCDLDQATPSSPSATLQTRLTDSRFSR